jgi:von Willebrand factor type A domain
LLTERKVKVHVYHCSARAGRIADLTDPQDTKALEEAMQAVRDLRPEGESSQLGSAVRQVLNDFRGSSLSAVVMLTDGVTTDGEDLAKVSRYASHLGVPLFFVGIGDHHDVRDLILHDLQVEDSVYVNDRLIFEVRVTGQGYTDLNVPITLREKGKPEILARQMVRVDPHGKPVKARLIHQPRDPGEKVYEIDIPVQPDEGNRTENNHLEHTVFVREAKLIKALYVEGSARYDFRYVKNLLERESAEDKRNKTVDLRVLLLDAGDEYVKQDKSALSEFPTQADLNAFDVVILGDADPQHPKLGEKHLADLAAFVRERGGGLLFLAGEHYNPHAYRNGPLKDVLPIEVTAGEQEEADRSESYHPELTPLGRFHPIFRFSPDEAENAAIWNKLAPVFWWSEGYKLKPAAEVLAVHPTRKAEAPRSGDAEEKHPLIVQQFVGAGRAMFFGIDETWRWRFREDELRFNQFWIQTIRYLARSRIGRVELRLDRQTPYRRGEPIKVTVRFPDDMPEPAKDTQVDVSVVRTLPGKDQTAIEKWDMRLEPVAGYRATYDGTLTRTPEGSYRFRLKSPEAKPVPSAEGKVIVPPDEMDRLRMNREEMEQAAEESQGRFYTLAEADRLVDELPSGQRVALHSPQPPQVVWNHPALFALALGLLGAEWFLRKRKHLL